jgi:hypothetical protein
MSNKSARILAATSWSETAEDDLVSNLGSRERTRQEVLFEILASEERYVSPINSLPQLTSTRYVAELAKMKDTFIDPLLHPFATSPGASPRMLDTDDYSRLDSPLESSEHLPPIAARFMSPSPFRADSPATITAPLPRRGPDNYKDAPNIDGESLDTDDDDGEGKPYPPSSKAPSKHNHPRSPYRASVRAVPFPSRSHQSLPPPPRVTNGSTQSLGTERERTHRASKDEPKGSTQPARVLRKFKKSSTTPDGILGVVLPHQLPEDLRICLEVVDSGVLEGHRKLSEALRKRYEEQYPLVRSLADVFVANVRAVLLH